MTARALILAFLMMAAPAAFGGDEQPATELKATVKDDAKAAATTGGEGFQNTVCTQGKNKRVVEITVDDAAKKAPCKVHYKKETEKPGDDQVIYNSANNGKFCEEKAKAFVDKLTGMGWSCAKG